MFKLLDLVLFRELKIANALLEAGKKVLEAFIILLSKVFKVSIGTRLSIAVAILVVYLLKVLLYSLKD